MQMTDDELRACCTYWRDMEYSDSGQSCVLARGCYDGFHFLVTNSHGYIPCGYVNVALSALNGKEWCDIKDIDCHGGLTFSGKYAPVTCEDGWWIGWDYAHWGDFSPMISCASEGERYDTADVVRECVTVIRQVVDISTKGGAK